MVSNTPITILGAGSWGTALALLLARNGNRVHLWGYDSKEMESLQKHRENQQYLPGFSFPDNLHIYTDLAASIDGVNDVFIAVPSHAFRSVLQQLKSVTSDSVRIAWGTKGLDPDAGELLHKLVINVFQRKMKIAVLSGPSFAEEVAAGKPTAVSLAGNDKAFLQTLVDRFHNDYFRIYLNRDIIGVELCGAIKNVLAIAVGIADGLQLGANARCALITRGLAEMSRLCVALGGKRETLMGLCGVGDLVLTCTDDQSRNRRFGLAIGRGETIEQAKAQIGQAVEGEKNTRQIYQLAKKQNIEMPITEQVYAIIYQQHSPRDVLKTLLERKPAFES